MRYSRLAAVAMAAGVPLLALYGAGEDDYYGDGTTRWEHATRGGGSGFLEALFVIASVIALISLFVAFAAKARRPHLWFIPAYVLYIVVFLYAWAILSLGH